MSLSEIAALDVDIEDLTVPGGPNGRVGVRLVKPAAAPGPLPVILYVHGGGRVADAAAEATNYLKTTLG
jgi:acetyl esterase